MDFNHELLDDRVVIMPDPVEVKTAVGLFIPDSAQRKTIIGTVIAIGKGTIAPDTGKEIPMFIKAGDKVMYNKFEFDEMPSFPQYIIGRQSSIISIIK